ncbi:beta-galactosidase [Amphibacillus marinus]|uniref:Beta-galactosidase n=2 Tax=Amphibacillus marinus TaxID=872970 RepID=A0A1H8M3C1_9BACI|nr:beta-galactosidase [Amphibacillus marinus]
MFKPVIKKAPYLLHGADYNPEQWLDYPGVFEEDLRLMKLAKCNVMSVGIFSWVKLEPEESTYNFEWLDHVIDQLHANGVSVLLATPSGARPAWMSEKYPEVLRVSANRVRNLHGMRHNHCYTSPIYREKIKQMNTKLAERYSDHPGVIGWHISNEYGGDCHCDHCQHAFRDWVKAKYQTLDKLNQAWWTTFWSHTYTSWSQVESPAPHGETMVHGQNLDWKRFVTDQTLDFYRHEVKPLKEKNAELPVTANFMEAFEGLNYAKFADDLDVVSWDSYPTWHFSDDDLDVAAWTSLNHDMFRSLKNGKPFLLMESSPSSTNWQAISKLKKPGMHVLSSIQAVAHGSDSVQYFQWRKSRGSSEKFHGAVVDHAGHEHTRVFQDVTNVGEALEQLNEITGSSVKPEVAIIFDTENRWALNDAQGPRNIGVHYERTVKEHYRTFWDQGIPVDIISADRDLNQYKLVVAPMLYMVHEGVGERIEAFVKAGGTFVTTYWSGIVNENDLCFLDGFPGPLRKTLGIWSEEMDALSDGQPNSIKLEADNTFGISGSFSAKELCDLIHLEGAESLATYQSDFYVGMPALTVNHFGEGEAYYIASRNEAAFTSQFFTQLVKKAGITPVLNCQLPKGVTAQIRSSEDHDYIFIMNFTGANQIVELDERPYQAIINRLSTNDKQLTLAAYGFAVLKRNK